MIREPSCPFCKEVVSQSIDETSKRVIELLKKEELI